MDFERKKAQLFIRGRREEQVVRGPSTLPATKALTRIARQFEIPVAKELNRSVAIAAFPAEQSARIVAQIEDLGFSLKKADDIVQAHRNLSQEPRRKKGLLKRNKRYV